MNSPSKLYPKKVNVTNCDKEPIHILGKIQAHGVLMVCDPKDYKVVHHSENAVASLSLKQVEILGLSLLEILGDNCDKLLRDHIVAKATKPLELYLNKTSVIAILHYVHNLIYIEFEPSGTDEDTFVIQQELSEIISVLSEASSVKTMCDKSAILIKELLGYDRVMLYQFDEQWNGKVISEACEVKLESWLGMHYPASDIPKQARALFLKQGVRIISDVNEPAVEIIPQISLDGNPLDLSLCELRAVSPIHIEYLKNMKVGATLTAAIVSNGQLWGLIACHHYSPKFLNYYKRLSVKFLSQVFATQLTLRASNEVLKRVNSLASTRSQLVAQMSEHWDLHKSLTKEDCNLLTFSEAEGAGLYYEGTLSLIGECPEKSEIIKFIQQIERDSENDTFTTRHTSQQFNSTPEFTTKASGVLSVFLTKGKDDCLIWFKPERRQTISWAGNPDKAVRSEGDKLTPRTSFERWNTEQVGMSNPWRDYEISAAIALRQSIQDVILQRYDEVKKLNEKLQAAYKELESFSYSVSHDLRAPLRGIDGFAQIIKEDYYDALDTYGKSAIKTIIDSTHKMNELIDDILAFSGIGAKELNRGGFSMKKAVKQSLDFLYTQFEYKRTDIIIQKDLPEVFGDSTMIFQLLNNLIGNALKYSKNKSNPVVKIGFQEVKASSPIFYVRDNGVGFDEKNLSKIFGVFNRLVGSEFEGTGIGLAIAKRVVDKHNGKIWAESKPDQGATFYFQLNLES